MRKTHLVNGLVICLALAGSFAFYLVFIRPWVLFSEERDAIGHLLHQWWEGRPPPDIDDHRWQETWVIVYNGFGNVCYAPKHVSLWEMQRFKADLQTKMQQPATLASLRWFWNAWPRLVPTATNTSNE